jgi:RND family efflux transporter MFP subunit
MNKRTIFIGAFIALLLVFGAQKLIANKKAVEAKLYIHDTSAAILVETIKPNQHTFDHAMSFLGTFEAIRQNTIGSEGAGRIVSIAVHEGDHISAGQLIARIDNEQTQLQIQAAQLNIQQLKNDYNRMQTLKQENAVSNMEVEKLSLTLNTAEVQLKQLQKQLRNSAITAPFSGVITKKMIDIGSMVMPGTPVVEVTDISSLKLTISVPERDVLKFKTGQDVAVTADVYGNKTFKGSISSIGVQADAAHNFKIQVTVKNNDTDKLMAGMYGSATLSNTESITALAIPRKALIGSSKDPKVYVNRGGKAKLVAFNAGTSDGEFIEVISGLGLNDQVITKGQVNIEDNSNVKTTN